MSVRTLAAMSTTFTTLMATTRYGFGLAHAAANFVGGRANARVRGVTSVCIGVSDRLLQRAQVQP